MDKKIESHAHLNTILELISSLDSLDCEYFGRLTLDSELIAQRATELWALLTQFEKDVSQLTLVSVNQVNLNLNSCLEMM
jgi:hypothetical protein